MTREGVWNPNGEGEQPDIPGGVAKDNARAKQPVIAYAVLYDRLKLIARDHGYALAMHGSLLSDCDLLAVPWIHDATDAQTLINALAVAAPGLAMSGSPRVHGRMSYIIHLGGGPYIDLSVMPRDAPALPQNNYARRLLVEAAPPAEHHETLYKVAATIVDRLQVETNFPINHHTRTSLTEMVQGILLAGVSNG